ncbi:MAG: hypothetical protein HOW73_03500 [Polyangiaceae bacterium]|nr:hypothetical protein [Polyangiaceae bacterium]
MVRTLRSLTNRISPKGLGCGCGAVVLGIIAAIIALVVQRCVPQSDEGAEADAAPRMLLGRVWFDKLPDRRTDSIDLWIFFGGGIGLHENGSSYRASFDLFEFERQGSRLEGSYLHDKKKLKTAFSVRACDDHPPFDLCLTLDAVDGKKVELYGFGDEEEMERAAPGTKGVLQAAKARGEHVKGSK